MYLKPIRFMFMIPTGIVVMEARELHVITDDGIVNRFPFHDGEHRTIVEVVRDAWLKIDTSSLAIGEPTELFNKFIDRLEEIANA